MQVKHSLNIKKKGHRIMNTMAFQGPISVDTLLTLDPDTGEIIGSWGSNFFYLPHGLTIDNYGYYYMTDVGLHQVRYPPLIICL